MKYLTYFFIMILVSCTNNSNVLNDTLEVPIEQTDDSFVIEFFEPVETGLANTEFKPLFEGQTRISGIKTQSDYDVKILTDILNTPWGIETLPDGKFVVSERNGTIVILNQDGSLFSRNRVPVEIDASGQGGILDVLVSPDFIDTSLIYLTLAEKTDEGSLTAVGKLIFTADLSTIQSLEIIYRATPYFKGNNHYGSRIIFDPNGDLFVSTGDRQSLETRNNAQTLNNGHGKIIHITTNGNAVSSNPFIHQADAHEEIFSIGHRNVQGLAIHPITGDLWANEMGPQGGDELNMIQSGKNYGWPIISYGEEYTGLAIGEGLRDKEGYEQPIYYWDPIIAPSGMVFYTSDVIKEWENNLFIGGLKSEHITRLLIVDNKVIGEERLLADEGQRFRDLTVGLDGALYAISDSGRLYRIGNTVD